MSTMVFRPFFFEPDPLEQLARRHGRDYGQASPFPHAVMDEFLPAWVGRRILEEFPAPGELRWSRYDDHDQKKLANESEPALGPFTRHLIAQLNSSTFVSFLEQLTGIDGLVPDPHLRGGGLHQIEPGGMLGVHADFNRHPRLKLDRRLNLLLYLNEDWDEAYGGDLELWDRDMKRCERRISPVFNRCVVFSTTDFSFHGHPEPLRCPKGRTRKSLALYYYSNGRPPEEVSDGHTTVFRRRPHDAPESPWSHVWRRLPRVVRSTLRRVPGRGK